MESAMTEIEAIEQILKTVKPYENGHHMGLPFMSAYQIAIELSEKYPELVNTPQALPMRVARTLSQAIKNGHCQNIEGGFISHSHINDMSFKNGYAITHPDGHSIFRYKGK